MDRVLEGMNISNLSVSSHWSVKLYPYLDCSIILPKHMVLLELTNWEGRGDTDSSLPWNRTSYLQYVAIKKESRFS
jgi:hypothetical protein